MTTPHLVVSAADIVSAMTETQGNVTRAAARLNVSQSNFRNHALRRGVDVPALRKEIALAAVPQVPDTGDALPSTQPLLAAAIVDLASMSMELMRLENELSHERRINASLVAALTSIGTHMEQAA